MEHFDKHMAQLVLEDALTDLDTPHGCGLATGLCGAFYMCGLISAEKWDEFLQHISTANKGKGSDRETRNPQIKASNL